VGVAAAVRSSAWLNPVIISCKKAKEVVVNSSTARQYQALARTHPRPIHVGTPVGPDEFVYMPLGPATTNTSDVLLAFARSDPVVSEFKSAHATRFAERVVMVVWPQDEYGRIISEANFRKEVPGLLETT